MLDDLTLIHYMLEKERCLATRKRGISEQDEFGTEHDEFGTELEE